MEFGRVPEGLLETINFSLPHDPITNKLVLTGEKANTPQVYIGCAKWGRKEWVGKIYPKGTKKTDF